MRTSLAALLLLAASPTALAQPSTPLLQDDLASNKRTRIDSADDGLDALMGGGGGGGFSTKKLETVEDRLRADLKRERPRATPRLVIFLYPGKVSAQRLRALSEIFVDMELVIDPCDRSVCRDAVGHHIEMVGRAVGQPVIATQDYKIVFKDLRLHTSTAMHGAEVDSYLVPIADCIAAGKRPGGGRAWLDARKKADTDYEPLLVKEITRNAQRRRVQLAATPSVRRSAGDVSVAVHVRGNRARVEQQVTDALWAVGAALAASPATPPDSHLEVSFDTGARGAPKRYRAAGPSVLQFVAGRITAATLWSSYVQEVREGKDAPTQLTFDDAEAAGHAPAAGGPTGDGAPDDNQVIAILGAHFGALGACAKAEAARDPKFRGVTVTFQWQPSGRAAAVTPKEPSLRGGPLSKCLESAVGALALPRFTGTARSVEYPIGVR